MCQLRTGRKLVENVLLDFTVKLRKERNKLSWRTREEGISP
jgi:hypothetical protein